MGQAPQVERLKKGVDILVATPGRLGDLYGQKLIDLSRLEIFVLDEADPVSYTHLDEYKRQLLTDGIQIFGKELHALVDRGDVRVLQTADRDGQVPVSYTHLPS